MKRFRNVLAWDGASKTGGSLAPRGARARGPAAPGAGEPSPDLTGAHPNRHRVANTARGDHSVGGDWCAVIDLPGGRTDLAVGDAIDPAAESATIALAGHPPQAPQRSDALRRPNEGRIP